MCICIVNRALKCRVEFLLIFVSVYLSGNRLMEKTWFQSHIVEQLKSYPMIVKTWESIQGNKNVPLFARGTFSSVC